MKPELKQKFLLVLVILTLAAVSLSCALSKQVAPAQPNAAAQQTTPPESAAAQDALLLPPDPLDTLLELRSIRFNLNTQRLDGTKRTVQAEIDPLGNMHITYINPPYDTSGMPTDFHQVYTSSKMELYVLDGKSYLLNTEDPAWKTTVMDEDFAASFASELDGMESPAMWLNLLPAGSVTASGTETVGGFETTRFDVSGEISGVHIFGTIWKDTQSHALVQAELHIPASLLSAPTDPQSGEMVITLYARKQEISADCAAR